MRSTSPASSLLASLALFGVLGLTLAGCDEEASALGTPCYTPIDCEGGLICDYHDGQGTCQEDHNHSHPDPEPVCASEDRDDLFAVGLSKSGDRLTATFVSADPAPPRMGDNTWVLSISDHDGAPAPDLDIVALPTMVDHGHGTSVEVEVAPTAVPGEYELSPVNLYMEGLWQIELQLSWAAGEGEDEGEDTLRFAFCVE